MPARESAYEHLPAALYVRGRELRQRERERESVEQPVERRKRKPRHPQTLGDPHRATQADRRRYPNRWIEVDGYRHVETRNHSHAQEAGAYLQRSEGVHTQIQLNEEEEEVERAASEGLESRPDRQRGRERPKKETKRGGSEGKERDR